MCSALHGSCGWRYRAINRDSEASSSCKVSTLLCSLQVLSNASHPSVAPANFNFITYLVFLLPHLSDTFLVWFYSILFSFSFTVILQLLYFLHFIHARLLQCRNPTPRPCSSVHFPLKMKNLQTHLKMKK